MTNLSTLADEARRVAQERLGKGVIEDVQVSDYEDWTGERAFKIVFVIDKDHPDLLTTEARQGIGLSLTRKLVEEGDDRFIYVRFIPRDELAEVAADD